MKKIKPFYINVEKLSYATKIGYTYIDQTGVKRRKITTSFKPTLHTLPEHSHEVFVTTIIPEITLSKLKTFDGKDLVQQSYTISQYAKIVKSINDGELEREHYYGFMNAHIQFLHHKFGTQTDVDLSKIRTGILDIETPTEKGFPYPDQAKYEVKSISLKDSFTKTIYVWGLKEYDKSKNTVLPSNLDIIYIKCDNEKELLTSFLKIYQNLDFDNITGWNTNQFDIPYLYYRLKKVFDNKTANKLSPYKEIWYTKNFDDTTFPLKIRGVANLDYLPLYKKYMYGSRESYALANIAESELGTTKIDYSEYNNLYELYNNNYQKFIEYNIYDVELIDLLDKKLGLIDLAMTMAYIAKCNFMHIFSPVMTWDVLLYHYLTKNGICVPPKKHIDLSDISYAGAYVKEPVKGLHDWVVTYDLNSLYPMIHIGCNISPDTILDRNKLIKDMKSEIDPMLLGETNFDPSKIQSASGWCFDKNKKGFIPKILETLYTDRVKIKQSMLTAQQNIVDIESEISRRGLKI
jgi:DNA polymerase elongation subunit (family B)